MLVRDPVVSAELVEFLGDLYSIFAHGRKLDQSLCESSIIYIYIYIYIYIGARRCKYDRCCAVY
jgi:hypothetical protein